MSIHPVQFRTLIVSPTLRRLGLYSKAAETLLMGTAAQESHLGAYIHQVGGGPAKGVFQMEPFTHDDIWANYLRYKGPLSDELRRIAGVGPDDTPSAELMVGNLYYAAGMARAFYLRKPQTLPAAEDLDGLARYWKLHYNTYLGRGTVGEFVDNYSRFVLREGV